MNQRRRPIDAISERLRSLFAQRNITPKVGPAPYVVRDADLDAAELLRQQLSYLEQQTEGEQ